MTRPETSEQRSGLSLPSRLTEWLPVVSVGRLRDRTRSSFWVVPSLSVVASIGLAIGFVALDRHLGTVRSVGLYPGPPSGARNFLSSIVTSMITVTGTVFSVSVLVLQLTNSQFSSRAIPMYLRDLTVQATLGLFLATFAYSLVVERSVGDRYVPRVAVSVAFIFVLASVGLFIRYISHISNMVRVANVVKSVAEESRRLLESRYPGDHPPEGPPPAVPPAATTVAAPKAGVVVSVNERRLMELAVGNDCVLVVAVRVGDYLPAGAPLCCVHPYRELPSEGVAGRSLEERVVLAIAQDTERSMEQDLAFGFRQLVDVAEKALSPSLNDPTTATQCLDSLHDLLRRLASRPLPDGGHRDSSGRVRVVIPQYRFEDYLQLALAEIWHYGRDAVQIPERIAGILVDLYPVARSEYRPALDRWRRRVGGGSADAPLRARASGSESDIAGA